MLNARMRTSFLGRGFYEMPLGLLATSRIGLPFNGSKSAIEPRYLKEYYKTPLIMHNMYGNGLFSGLTKLFSWFKPIASKAWTTIKNIIPKIGDIVPQIGTLGEKVFNAVKTKDASKIGELFTEGQKIGQQVLTTGKEGYSSIRDILNHNRKMQELSDKTKSIDIANRTKGKRETDALESVKAQGDILASKVEANDPDKTVVTDVTGKGLITRLLKKNSKLLRGRGFKLIR